MSQLVNGRIPANTECPFRARCPFAQSFPGRKPKCHHLGVNHPVPFSCATARLFVIMDREENNDPE